MGEEKTTSQKIGEAGEKIQQAGCTIMSGCMGLAFLILAVMWVIGTLKG